MQQFPTAGGRSEQAASRTLPECNDGMRSSAPSVRSMHASFLGLRCVAGPRGCHRAPFAAAQHTSAMPTMCSTGPPSTPANNRIGQPEEEAPLDCTRLHSALQTCHGTTTGARRKGPLTGRLAQCHTAHVVFVYLIIFFAAVPYLAATESEK